MLKRARSCEESNKLVFANRKGSSRAVAYFLTGSFRSIEKWRQLVDLANKKLPYGPTDDETIRKVSYLFMHQPHRWHKKIVTSWHILFVVLCCETQWRRSLGKLIAFGLIRRDPSLFQKWFSRIILIMYDWDYTCVTIVCLYRVVSSFRWAMGDIRLAGRWGKWRDKWKWRGNHRALQGLDVAYLPFDRRTKELIKSQTKRKRRGDSTNRFTKNTAESWLE